MAPTDDPRSQCPVVFALDLFGDRWSLLVIRDMVFRGFSTYSEFLNAGEGISTNILADRLKRLESAGIVTKGKDPDHGAKYRYGLSQGGLDLVPVLVEMMRWSAKHDPDTPMSKAFRRKLERDPGAVADELVKRAQAPRSS